MISYELIRALPDDVSVTLLTFATGAELPPEVRRRSDSTVVLPVGSYRLAVVKSLFMRAHINALQRATRAARRAVRELSTRCDVTLVHGPHSIALARQVRGPLVFQAVDPWSMRVAMEVAFVTGWRAGYRSWKARQALRLERNLPERSRLLTVGRRDAEVWSSRIGRPVGNIANGAPPERHRRRPSATPTVCFAGSLNYAPNIDSAQILVRTIAPLVWNVLPQARFVIAGRRPDPSVLSLANERVLVLADVPAMDDVFGAAHVAVFPDRYGLGVRNSVREALASGLPVIATPAATREQEPHALLTVAEDTGQIAQLALKALRGPASPSSAGDRNVRSWAVMAREYWAECQAALGSHRS